MKKVYLLATALAFGGLTYGQYTTSARSAHKLTEQASVERTHLKPTVEHGANNSNRGTAFWTENFANGLASTNGNWTLAGPDQLWKQSFYKSSGEWSVNTAAPATTTASNGFMLFDADSSNFPVSPNYLDKAGELISPSINCSAEASVNVVFEQEFRYCCNASDLELMLGVSNDGGANWTEFAVDGSVDVNINSATPDAVSINISCVAANQSNVNIRFRFGGVSHYYWLIDDVSLTSSPDHEVELLNTRWVATNSGIPYTMVPNEQNQPFRIFGDLSNQGANSEDVTFTASVVDPTVGTTLFNGSGAQGAITMPAGSCFSVSDSTATWNSGIVTGAFDMNISFTYPDIALDLDVTNNTVTNPFWVTDYVYGRDSDTYTGNGLWNGEDASGISNGYYMGPEYRMETTQTIYAIETALTNASDPGALIFCQIYAVDATGFTLVYDGSGGSDERAITAADISASPTITPVLIPINNGLGFQMDAGTSYVVCVGHYGGNEAIVLMNGQVETPEQTVFLFDQTQVDWFFVTSVPVLRGIFDPGPLSINKNEQSNITLGQNVPNPFNGTSVITYALEEAANVTLEVTDIAGKIVKVLTPGTVSAGEHQITLNGNEFAKGMYNYTLKADNFSATKRMIITK